MTDLSANASLKFIGEIYTEKFIMDSSAANHAYRGAPMIVDQSEDTTNVRVCVSGTTVAPTDVFVGIALEEVDVASGDDEDEYIEVAVGPTIVGFKSSVFDDGADLGATVYMSDSDTLDSSAADDVQIGKVFRVKDGYVYVELSAPQICTGA